MQHSIVSKPNSAIVLLTGSGAVFTAGLDFDHHFRLFARRSLKEIDAWFDAYRATNLSLFTYPRLLWRQLTSRLCRRADYCARLRSPHSWRGSTPILIERGAHRHPDASRLLRDHQARGRSARGIWCSLGAMWLITEWPVSIRRVVEHGVGQELFQLAVLVRKLLQAPSFGQIHAAG
jgi:hypothetical protein